MPTFPPMPPPPSSPVKPYILAGKVQYHGSDVTGAKIWFENETSGGSKNMTSGQSDSNFAYNMSNLSVFNNNDIILVSVTHNGRRGQKRITINTSNPGEDIGTIHLQAHWGCIS